MSRRKGSDPIPEGGDAPRLVEREPVFDAVSVAGEAEAGVVEEVWDDVLLGEEAAVPVVERGGDVPVVLRGGGEKIKV